MNLNLMAPPAARFGAKFNVQYGNNLQPAVFQQAAELSQAQASLSDRVTAIQDRKDPIDIKVSLNNEGISAQLATRENGTKSFALEAGQTIAQFATKLVEQAETLAATLTNSSEKDQAVLNQANEYINKLVVAMAEGNIHPFAGTHHSKDSFEFGVSFGNGGMTFSVVDTGEDPTAGMMSVKKEPYNFGQKYTFKPLSNDKNERNLTIFSITLKNGQVTQLSFKPSGSEAKDLLTSTADAQAVQKFGQKASRLALQINQALGGQ